jgi:riboflavin kinase / FMN adenylyltransferase
MTSGSSSASAARGPEEIGATPSSVAIGFFDGVHRGHQMIVRRACRAAGAGGAGLRPVMLTFDRHPMAAVAPDHVPPLLMEHPRRYQTLADLGATVVALPFTPETSQLEPEQFVHDILVQAIGARHVVVGANFRFGRRASGDTGALRHLGDEHGFSIEIVDLLALGDTPISSTQIRASLDSGDVAWAARALGRPHLLEGEVVTGDRRGRELGVPTANVAVDPEIQLPAHGIYAGYVRTPQGRVPAATNIGVRPTFAGDDVTVEAHLIDWDGDLYGQHITIEVRHRLREERAFADTDELIAQMHRDIEEARTLLATAEPMTNLAHNDHQDQARDCR